MFSGWVKVYRRVLEKGWLTNPKLWAFWSWCLLKASHQEHTVIVGHQSVNLLPGQFVFGRKQASRELGQSEQSIRTHLKFLHVVEQNITIQTTNKYSIISIINWGSYQGEGDVDGHQSDQPLTSQQPAIDRPLTTNKNGKNGNKEEIKKRYGDFVQMTDAEHEKLISQFGEKGTKDRIEALNIGIGSKGYKYRSHYHTILAWERKNSKAKVNNAVMGGLVY